MRVGAVHENGKPNDNRFYIVRDGAVTSGGLTPVKYGRTQFFGQVELLQNTKNQETRRAEGTTSCCTWRKEDFMKLVPLHALIRDSSQQSYALQSGPDAKGKAMRGRRFGESAETSAATAAGAGGPSKALGKGGGAKSEQAIARIMGAVKTNIIFSRLNDLQLQMLQSAMAEHAVPAGADVITQGEKGNHFFVVDVRIPVSAIQHLGRPIPALPASLPVLTRGRWIDTVRGRLASSTSLSPATMRARRRSASRASAPATHSASSLSCTTARAQRQSKQPPMPSSGPSTA